MNVIRITVAQQTPQSTRIVSHVATHQWSSTRKERLTGLGYAVVGEINGVAVYVRADPKYLDTETTIDLTAIAELITNYDEANDWEFTRQIISAIESQ